MTEEKQISGQVGRGVVWMAVGSWTEQAMLFVFIVVLARLLGTETFGLLAMAAAFVLFAEFLVRETLGDFLIATKKPEREDFDAAFWGLLVLALLLAAALVVGAPIAARAYEQPQVARLMPALAPGVLFIALGAVPVAILRRELRFRSMAIRAIAGVGAGGVVAIALALNGFGIWALVGQRLAQTGTNALLAWLAVDWRPGRPPGIEVFRRAFRFGSGILTLRAAELARSQVPVVMIGGLAGPAAAGAFTIAWRVVELGSFLIATPLRTVAQPAFAAVAREGRTTGPLLLQMARIAGFVALPAFAGLAVTAPFVVPLIFGDKWDAAVPLLTVLAMLGAYLSIDRVQSTLVLASGRIGPLAAVEWLEVTVLAIALWALAPSAVAMSAAIVVALVLLWPLRFAIAARLAGVSAFSLAAVHLPPLVAAAAMAAAVTTLAPKLAGLPVLVQLAGAVGAGLVVFGALAALFMRERFRLILGLVARGAPQTGQEI